MFHGKDLPRIRRVTTGALLSAIVSKIPYSVFQEEKGFFCFAALGPVQTSNFPCAEPNTNLVRPK